MHNFFCNLNLGGNSEKTRTEDCLTFCKNIAGSKTFKGANKEAKWLLLKEKNEHARPRAPREENKHWFKPAQISWLASKKDQNTILSFPEVKNTIAYNCQTANNFFFSFITTCNTHLYYAPVNAQTPLCIKKH